MVRIVTVDDHPLVRAGVKASLESEPGWQIVAESEAPPHIRQVVEINPNVIVLDIEIPGWNVFEFAEKVKTTLPEVKIVFFSAYFTETFFEKVMEVRGSAYALKSAGSRTLIEAIKSAIEDRFYVCPNIRQQLPEGFQPGDGFDSELTKLTVREREVLVHLAQGSNVKEIAGELNISHRTVDRHKSNIMDKLNLHSQVKLAWFAMREGLVNPRSSQH